MIPVPQPFKRFFRRFDEMDIPHKDKIVWWRCHSVHPHYGRCTHLRWHTGFHRASLHDYDPTWSKR